MKPWQVAILYHLFCLFGYTIKQANDVIDKAIDKAIKKQKGL